MLTLVGHSSWHCLQLKQRSLTAFIDSDVHSRGSSRPVSQSRSTLALERGLASSRLSMRKNGHIREPGDCVLQSPHALQLSTSPKSDCSVQRNCSDTGSDRPMVVGRM